MPDLEPEIAERLRRRAASLPIDDEVRDRLVRRVRTHRRRRRAVLAGAPVVVALVALAIALTVPSVVRPGPRGVRAAPTSHVPPGTAVSRQPAPTSPGAPAIPPGGGGDLRWVDFVSPMRGWALARVQGRTRVARTSDGGARWALVGAPLPERTGGPAPTRLVVAVGGNGIGANVADLYAYTGTGPTGGGGSRRLDVSLDRGASWRAVELPGPVLGIAPPSGPGPSTLAPPVGEGELWALIGPASRGGRGGPARLEVSTDAGRTWAGTAAMPGAGRTGQLARVSRRGGFVVSERTRVGRSDSVLFETTDGGGSWRRLADPCGSMPDQQLSAIGARHLWLACGGEPSGSLQAKAVYVSTDAARTWRRAARVGLATAAPPGALGRTGIIAGVAAVSRNDAWLALGRGPLDVTTDRGRTWRPAFSAPPGRGGAVQVAFVDATHGWALTPHGLWGTSDGARWRSLGARRTRATGDVQTGATDTTGCTTTVHGVVPGPASLSARWLPAGFHLTSGTTSDPTSGLTYSPAGSDPPRIELHLSNNPGPLTAAGDGGHTSATTVEVQGHPGLLEEGPPDPQFIGVSWKATTTDLLSVVGYDLPAATILDVAAHVAFRAPGAVSLPVQPGPVVTAASAVTAARAATHLPRSPAQAKLSSWTEIAALLHADHAAAGFSVPSAVALEPWEPVWAVLLTETPSGAGPAGSSPTSPGAELVVLDAASGTVLATGAVAHRAWFAGLTDRDPSAGGCPGGSTARLPFGVLTRVEETYVVTSSPAPPGAPGATESVIEKLTTVPVLNRADPGLYGGCVQQDCSLDELVWPTIVVVRAPRGKTLACLPGWASYPPGYRPKQVSQYVTISVAGNTGILCGPVPGWVGSLRDLAPAAGT